MKPNDETKQRILALSNEIDTLLGVQLPTDTLAEILALSKKQRWTLGRMIVLAVKDPQQLLK